MDQKQAGYVIGERGHPIAAGVVCTCPETYCPAHGKSRTGPEERLVGFSIFQDVITNDGRGFRRNGVPISDEEATKIWEESPDNPKNKKPVN